MSDTIKKIVDVASDIDPMKSASSLADKAADASVTRTDEQNGAEQRSAPVQTPRPDSGLNKTVTTKKIWIPAWTLVLCWLGVITLAVVSTYGIKGLPTQIPPLHWTGIAALAIFPMLIIFLCAYSLVQLSILSSQSRALTQAADAISKPDQRLEARAASLASAIRSQVINVDSSLETSLKRLAGVEITLKGHTDALANSHIAATRQTGEISQRLSEERDGLKSISTSFDERMNALSRMMSEHSERLAQSTHMAEQKIQEARVSVEGAAAKINASSEIVRDNAMQASTSLSESEDSISTLAAKIEQQARNLDDINARHAAEMGALVEQLRIEQAEMSTSIEERLDKMRDMSLSATVSAQSLAEASEAGRKTVQALAESANIADSAVKQRFAQMEEMVEYSSAKADSISERAAKRVRDSLSLTRMEIGRIEGDMAALEMHMADKSGGLSSVNVTPKTGLRSGWRKSLLRFRPIEEKTEGFDDNPEMSVATVKSSLNITSIDAETADTDVTDDTDDSVDTMMDIPAFDTHDASAPLIVSEPDLETMSVPETIITQKNAPVEIAQPIASEDEALALEKSTLQHQSLDSDSFDIEFNELPELELPQAELELQQDAENLIIPIEPENLPLRKASKGGWSWRSMLGGLGQSDVSTTSNSPLESGPSITPTKDLNHSSVIVIDTLKNIGLAPNVMVDDGCIIECVNSAKAKGIDAISPVVQLRLSGPVAHLKDRLALNSELLMDVSNFAQQYRGALLAYQTDREGLRSQLETEAGRAFLLCDAAL